MSINAISVITTSCEYECEYEREYEYECEWVITFFLYFSPLYKFCILQQYFEVYEFDIH